jgi:hypothetical protein
MVKIAGRVKDFSTRALSYPTAAPLSGLNPIFLKIGKTGQSTGSGGNCFIGREIANFRAKRRLGLRLRAIPSHFVAANVCEIQVIFLQTFAIFMVLNFFIFRMDALI